MPIPDLIHLQALVPGFLLALFRVAGLMLFAPLFGSTRIPRRVKFMLALAMTACMVTTLDFRHTRFPDDMTTMAVAMAGEMLLGVALGMIVSLTFIATQWAGEMVGQQIGFNMAQALDPQFGGGGSVVGDLYFMLTMAIFLIIGGHRVMIDGIHQSLLTVPPGELLFSRDALETVLHFITSSTMLALRIASPIFVTMLVVDVALGCLSKTMPQLNIMSAGMSMRSIIGLIVLIAGAAVTASVIESSLGDSLLNLPTLWKKS
ncbi:MAG: flagellar biosynthetic protein FliR [Tepidisphaeraceae bacterium]